MKTHHVLLAAAAMLLAAAPAISAADERPFTLVELFTSQGCNSCPPADQYVGELSKRDDVLPLSFNVDYWDYLGWKDSLARREWTERQRAYARVLASRYVYTPQLVIAGASHVVGSERAKAEAAIAAAAQRTPVPMRVRGEGAQLRVSIGAGKPEGGAGLWLARYDPAETVAIGRGENGGRTITYHNVVRELTRLGNWRGEPLEQAIEPDLLQGPRASVLFLQADGFGPILGAVRLSPPRS